MKCQDARAVPRHSQSSILAALLLLPLLGFSKTDLPIPATDRFICGTSAERERSTLARAQYQENLERRAIDRGIQWQAAAIQESPSLQIDHGDVAVLEDDGTIFSTVNLFDLAGKSFRFEPTGTGSFKAVPARATPDQADTTAIVLQDDDTQRVDLDFLFTYYGKAYDSAWVNSDGNLTLGAGDASSTPRDLGRFISGPPRIGPFFADLDPTAGSVAFRRDSEGTLFIWRAVPNFGGQNSNTFSVKLFKNGSIEFAYGERIDGSSAVVGISRGSDPSGVNAMDFSRDLPTASLAGSIVEVFASQSEISETALARKFLQIHPDDFDHLIVFLAFDFNLGGAYAYELNVKNEIGGIGLQQTDNSSFYGSKGRLRSFIMMGSLDGPNRYPSDPNKVFLGTNSTLGILGQETGHRWLAFVGFLDGDVQSRAILGRQAAHWSFFFDSDASVMEGNDIQDRGEERGIQRFLTVGATSTYSLLDQYLMGLLGQESVPEKFMVEMPAGTSSSPSSAPAIGVTFGGTRKKVTIESIIAAHGPRTPSVLQSPKIFRQAFILLTRRGQIADPEQIAKVQRIRDAWVPFIHEQTAGRAWVLTNLQPIPGTTNCRLSLPHFQGDSREYAGLALANWGDTPTDILFTLFDNSGKADTNPKRIINPRMITLAPGAQAALVGEHVHGLALDDSRAGWIQAQSSSSQVAGFFVEGNLDGKVAGGIPARMEPSKELYFACAQTGTGGTSGRLCINLLQVANPASEGVDLEFSLVEPGGMVLSTAKRALPPNGRLVEGSRSLFTAIEQSVAQGYIKLNASAPVVGYQSIDCGSAMNVRAAQRPSISSRLYSAHFISGVAGDLRYATELNLINTTRQNRYVRVQLVGNDGELVRGINNPVFMNLPPGNQMCLSGETLFAMPPAPIDPGRFEGSLHIFVEAPGLIGDVTIAEITRGRILTTLPLNDRALSKWIFPHIAHGTSESGNSYYTGLAFYNPGESPVVLTLEAYSNQGVLTGTTSFTLPRHHRTSKLLNELIPSFSQMGGYIRVLASGGPLVGAGLFGDHAFNYLCSVPPEPITP